MNLQELSKQNVGPEKIPDPFSSHFQKSPPGPSEMSEIDPKSIAGKVKDGSFGVAVGLFGLEFGPYGSKLV